MGEKIFFYLRIKDNSNRRNKTLIKTFFFIFYEFYFFYFISFRVKM